MNLGSFHLLLIVDKTLANILAGSSYGIIKKDFIFLSKEKKEECKNN